MKKLFVALALLLAVALGTGAAMADRRGGGGGNHHDAGRHGGGHHDSGGWSGAFYYGGYPGWSVGYWGGGIRPGWGGFGYWAGYPYGYPYWTYPRYRVVESPVVYVEEPVTVYAPPASAAPAATKLWFYCTDPEGYYPYVQQCNKTWMEVIPQADTGSGSAPRLARQE